MTSINQNSLAFLNTFNGAIPPEGPKVMTSSLNWSTIASPAIYDLVLIKQLGRVSGLQGLFIDNSANSQPVTVQSSILNLPLVVPGNFQGIFPLFVTDQVKLTVSTTGSGTTNLFFLNFPVAAAVWPGINQIMSFNGSGALQVSESLLDSTISSGNVSVIDSVLATTISGGVVHVSLSSSAGSLTDGSGTIAAGGTSQQIFAANASRKYLLIENISSGDLWFNFTTAAVINQPSILIPSKTGFVMESNFISGEIVNIIGATTGQAFTAKQA